MSNFFGGLRNLRTRYNQVRNESFIYRPLPAEQWKCGSEVTIAWSQDSSVPKGTKVNFFLMDSYQDSSFGDAIGMLQDSYAFKRMLHDKISSSPLINIDYHEGSHTFVLDCDKKQDGWEHGTDNEGTALINGDPYPDKFGRKDCEYYESGTTWENWPNQKNCANVMPALRKEMSWDDCLATPCNARKNGKVTGCNGPEDFDCTVYSYSKGFFSGDINFHWDVSWKRQNRPLIFNYLLMERSDQYVFSGEGESAFNTIHDNYPKVLCKPGEKWPDCWDNILPVRSLGPVWVVNDYIDESIYPDSNSNAPDTDYANDANYNNNYNIWGPKQWMPVKDFNDKPLPEEQRAIDKNIYTLSAKASLVARASMNNNVGKNIDLKEGFGEYEILYSFMEGVLGTFIMRSLHDNAIVIAFRATEESGMNSITESTNLPDWMTNFLLNPTGCTDVLEGCSPEMVVHSGIMYEYSVTRDEIRRVVKELVSGSVPSPCEQTDPTQWRIIFSGMSQGGGIATVAYFDVVNYIAKDLYKGDLTAAQEKNVFMLQTYGGPPVGNVAFTNKLQSMFPSEDHRDRFVMSFSKDEDKVEAAGWFVFPKVDYMSQKLYAEFKNYETSPVSDYDREVYKIPEGVQKVHWVKGDLIAEVINFDEVVGKDPNQKLSLVGVDYNQTGLSAFKTMDKISLIHFDSERYLGWAPKDPSFPTTTGSKSGNYPSGVKEVGKGAHRLTAKTWPNNDRGCAKDFCPVGGQPNDIDMPCFPEDGIAGMGDLSITNPTAAIEVLKKIDNILGCPPRHCHSMALYGWGIKEDFKNNNLAEGFLLQTKPEGPKYGCKARFGFEKHESSASLFPVSTEAQITLSDSGAHDPNDYDLMTISDNDEEAPETTAENNSCCCSKLKDKLVEMKDDMDKLQEIIYFLNSEEVTDIPKALIE